MFDDACRRAAKGAILAYNARRCHGRGAMQVPWRTSSPMNQPPRPFPPDAALPRAPESSSAAAPHIGVHRCRNCGTEAPGAYCPACGQETRLALPTVRELMREATGRLVAIDGRLWRTLRLLMFRPGMLTREYLEGRRKRYVRPARLFFVMSILLFATIRLVVPASNIVTLDVGDDKPAVAASPAAGGAGPAAAAAGTAPTPTATKHVDPELDALLTRYGRYVPAQWSRRIARFQELSTEDQNEHIYSGLLRYAPYAMVVLLPAFALLQYASYLPGRRRHPRRPARYVEHLVYGAHLHAFAFVMLIAIILMPLPALRWALMAWIVVYVGRARGNVYGGTWLGGLFRTLASAAVYVVLLAIAMTALLALSIATN
jgi:hypothetical protein